MAHEVIGLQRKSVTPIASPEPYFKAPTTVSRRQAHTQTSTRLASAGFLTPTVRSLWDGDSRPGVKHIHVIRWLWYDCWLLNVPAILKHASVFQGWICSDDCTCCHTEIEVADPTFYLTQSQYTDTRPTSPSADPFTPGSAATGVPMFQSLV